MDTNIMILNVLYSIASQVWAGFTFTGSGVYTAKEIFAQKRGKEDLPIHYNYHDHYTDGDGYTFDGERFSISVDTFTCAFPADQVFRLVDRFEQLAGVKRSAKKVYDTDEERPRACNLMIEMDKSASALAKCVDNDQWRPVLQSVYLDLNRGALVASDGHILQAYPVRLLSESNVDHDTPLLLPAALFKAYKGGPVEIGYDVFGGIAHDIVCQYAGKNYKLAEGGRYPNWARLPVYEDMRLTFSKQDWAGTLKAAKRLVKYSGPAYCKLAIYGQVDQQHVTIAALSDYDEIVATEKLSISNIVAHNFMTAVDGRLLLKFKTCNAIYMLNSDTPLLLTTGVSIGMLMPCLADVDVPNERHQCAPVQLGDVFLDKLGTTGEAVDTVGMTTTGEAVNTVGTTTTGEAVDTVGTTTTGEAVDTVGTTTAGEAVNTVGTTTTGEAVDDVDMYQHTGYITPPRFGMLVGMDLHTGYITPPPRFGMLVGMDLHAWCITPPPRFGMLVGMDLHAWCIAPPPRWSYLFGPPGGLYRPRGHPQPIGLYGQLVSAPAANIKNRYYRTSQKSPDFANKARAGPGKTMGASYYRGSIKS